MRYEKLFKHMRQQKKLAYVPFVIVSDPTAEIFLDIVHRLVESGADALELGFSFSDPVADGPVIQEAGLRPLAEGFTVSKGFELIAQIRKLYPNLPLGLLTYANLVYSNGIENFYQQAQCSGLDSVLIADCPVEECAVFSPIAKSQAVQSVYIAPPGATDEVLASVAKNSEGYTYVLSRKGITGTEVAALPQNGDFLKKLKSFNSPPLVQGFGISKPKHIFQAAKAGIDGVITGSAIVMLINQYHSQTEVMLDKVANYAKMMANAAHNPYDY